MSEERVKELEAQLAEAHRVIDAATDALRPDESESDKHIYGLLVSALSAPALARAAKLDRLRREVCAAAEEEEAGATDYAQHGGIAPANRRNVARGRKLAALDRLRAAEEGWDA